MSRALRIEYEGAWYHVMNRGRRGESVFEDPNDYSMFIEVLKDAVELWDVRISAYCLMPNHYHLLIHTPRGNLSRSMRHVNGVYTQRFNRAHGLEGALFRGRFKSILVDGESYLLQLVRYIHRNPIRAGVANHLEQYPWSSHMGYLSSAKKWDWVYKGFILSVLSSKKEGLIRAYKRFMQTEDSEEITKIFERKRGPIFIGEDRFGRWLKGRYFEKKRDPQVPESVALAPDLDMIKESVCAYYQVEESELLRSRRGQFNEARSMAIYLSRMLRKDTLMEICSEFGLSGYSSASSVLAVMSAKIQKSRRLRKRYEAIRGGFIISQTET